MKNRNSVIIAVIGAVVLILLGSSVYTVDEREQVVITRLGKIVRSIQQAGIHLKTPFLENVNRFSAQRLESDPTTESAIYTADKKILLVDNYVVWRIIDPELYLQAFPGGEYYAERRLGEVIFSALRQELGRHTQDEVVVHNREAIMDTVTSTSDQAMRPMGVEVIDVRIKRADLPPENARSVYGRMVAERQREATRYRSNGEREATRIMSEADRDAQITLARAQQMAQGLRGLGDGQAVKTYATAYNRDRGFYEFSRSLESYESALDSSATLVLTSRSPYLKYFFKGRQGR